MIARPWLTAATAAVVIAVTIAAIATYLDWRLNPAGLFRNEAGTDWRIVLETWFSWFGPLLIASGAVAAAIVLAIRILAQRRQDRCH